MSIYLLLRPIKFLRFTQTGFKDSNILNVVFGFRWY